MTGPLEDNLGPQGDDAYEMLMRAHEGLSDAESQALNARLILLMMNTISDAATLAALIAEAKKAG